MGKQTLTIYRVQTNLQFSTSNVAKQAGAELGQAQVSHKLDFKLD